MMNDLIALPAVLTPDFCVGVLVTLLGVAVYRICRPFFTGVTLARIQAIANAPVKHVGDDTMINVYGETPADDPMTLKGVADISPFCIRVEAYLRLIHQPYVKHVTNNYVENPRHKIPFANVFGEMVDDSSRIIKVIQRKLHLEEKSDDATLTVAQRTTGHLVRSLLFQDFYFTLLHALADTSWGHNLIRDVVKDKVPLPFLRPWIVRRIIEREHSNSWGQGYGRYPETYIVEKAIQDFHALSETLGDNKYILGTAEPTVYDTDLYAFMSWCFLETAFKPLSWMGFSKQKFPNLVDHTYRMKHILYPELDKEVEGEYLAEEAS